MTGQSEDNHQPGPKWEFNADVASKFDDMLGRSIPGYVQMRELAFDLGKRFIPDHRCNIIDLGASRGESASGFIESKDLGDAQFYLTEVSEPMLDQMRERWEDRSNVHPVHFDMRKSHRDIGKAIRCPRLCIRDVERAPPTRVGPATTFGTPETVPSLKDPEYAYPTTLVQAILTLIFVPINFRQSIIQGVYDGLAPGGAFILVEKVLGNTALTQDLLVDSYHEHKNRHGYSWEDIERKRAALEGVQVPVRSEENLAMLRNAGFRHVEVFWRHLNFEGTIAIKD